MEKVKAVLLLVASADRRGGGCQRYDRVCWSYRSSCGESWSARITADWYGFMSCRGHSLLGADILARTVLAPVELPGVVTALFGPHFSIMLLRRTQVILLRQVIDGCRIFLWSVI